MKLYRVLWTHPADGNLCERFFPTKATAKDFSWELKTRFETALTDYSLAREDNPDEKPQRRSSDDRPVVGGVAHPGRDPEARFEAIEVPTDKPSLINWLNSHFSWS